MKEDNIYLEGKSEGLVSGSGGGNDGFKTALRRVVPSALPSLHSTAHPLYKAMFLLVCNMLSPCHLEMGTKGTDTCLRLVIDLLETC